MVLSARLQAWRIRSVCCKIEVLSSSVDLPPAKRSLSVSRVLPDAWAQVTASSVHPSGGGNFASSMSSEDVPVFVMLPLDTVRYLKASWTRRLSAAVPA